MTNMKRRGAAALLLLLGVGGGGAQAAAPAAMPLPAVVTFPEGVAYDPASRSLFAGSAVDGRLVRIDAASGKATPLLPPGQTAKAGATFPAMLGMKVDGRGRLWIAGGFTGTVSLVDPQRGRLLGQATVPTMPKTLLNDLVLTGGHAYVTDTFVPTLWRVATTGDRIGALEPWLDLRGTPIAFADGPNLNGIAATADGRSLVVVQMNKGKLFRIDIASKAVTPIDAGAADLVGTDGLVLDGTTLYAVRQWAGEIVTLALDADLSHASERARYRDPGLLFPATAAQVGDALVVVNAQFDKHDKGAPTLPFGLVKVPLAELQPRR